MKKKLTNISIFAFLALVVMIGIWSVSAAAAAGSGDVIVNEIMQNPSEVSDSNGEWFELYNTTGADIDLDGWTIEDDGSESFTIEGSLLIPAGDYLVLGNNADMVTNGGVEVDYEYSGFFLSNGSDEIILLDENGMEINRVEWDGGDKFPDPSGASMSLQDPALDNNDGFNWCTASTEYGDGDLGTPGAANDCAQESCGETFTPIYTIQGNGSSTPIPGPVSTEGVVTGDFQGFDKLNGFFIQDPIGDGDPATSDGIFVFSSGSRNVEVGDKVRVAGVAGEFFGQSQIGNVSQIWICGTDTVAPTSIELPVSDLGDWEMYEGMLLTFPQTLYATDHFNQVRFGEVVLSVDGRQYQPTNVVDPGVAANDMQDLNDRSRILLDDGSDDSNPLPAPYMAADKTLRIGDMTSGVTGNLGYGFSNYRLQPTVDISFARVNERPESPDDVGGVIKVANFNLLNYWTTLGGRGAATADEFARQEEKLVSAILGLGADIVAVQELENNDDMSLDALVAALNKATAPDTWAAVPEPANFTSDNAIKVGIIYQTANLTTAGDSMALTDPAFDIARQPIAQTFAAAANPGATPEIFTVISNHFKSKGCSDATGLDEDQNDGQSCYNATRDAEAAALLTWVAEIQALTGDDDVVVAGDFNSYLMEDPIKTLNSGLFNTMTELDSADQYSYVFFGQAGYLDFIFLTDNMTINDRFKGVDAWHISPDEPRGLDYTDKPALADLYQPDQYRASDHDPILAGFCDEVGPDIEIVLDPDILWPPNHRHRRVTADVTVIDNFDPDPVWELVSVTSSEPDNGKGDGNTTDDIIIIDEVTFDLRAERSGLYDGRYYTITYTAVDSCGNETEASAMVIVPHDMRNYDPKEVKLPNNPK